jgi:cytochrome c-type biogenesis protein CcmH
MMQVFISNRLRLVASVFIATLLLLGAGDDSVRIERLGHQMMCACGCNQILLECNHVGCTYSDRMRGELAAAVDSGKNDSGVLQYFVEKYGTTVLAAPTKTGFNGVAWVIPYLALVFGIAAVVLAVHSWRRRVAPAKAPSSASSKFERFREQARRETEI